MDSKRIAAAAAVGAAVAATAVRKVAERGSRDGDVTRWRVVTVNRSPDDVRDTAPGSLADWGDRVELRTQTAPGDKGTELWARWREGADLSDQPEPVRALRTALREAKQLLEVGWVLEPDHNTTSQDTPLNAPLRKAVKTARGEGLL